MDRLNFSPEAAKSPDFPLDFKVFPIQEVGKPNQPKELSTVPDKSLSAFGGLELVGELKKPEDKYRPIQEEEYSKFVQMKGEIKPDAAFKAVGLENLPESTKQEIIDTAKIENYVMQGLSINQAREKVGLPPEKFPSHPLEHWPGFKLLPGDNEEFTHFDTEDTATQKLREKISREMDFIYSENKPLPDYPPLTNCTIDLNARDGYSERVSIAKRMIANSPNHVNPFAAWFSDK